MNAIEAILAHQGGWDEALWVMIPILIAASLLRAASRRERERLDEMDSAENSVEPADVDTDAGELGN